MAVEEEHSLNFFQTLTDANMNPYNNCFNLPLLSGTTTESFAPMHNNSAATIMGIANSFQAKEVVKTDHLPVSRKRPRESIDPMTMSRVQNGYRCGSVAFLGEDVSLQIQRQQLEMERLISQHNDEVRIAIMERRKKYSGRIIAAVEERIMNRLKAKDDEIEKFVKLNWALQERVESLSVEGQIWRDLAHTNEAAVHALRTNLEKLLDAQLNNNELDGAGVAALADDAQSCCGSNYLEEDGEEWGTRGGNRRCRHCGEGESSVLLLPCRHLCLCTVCGSSVHTCPVCKTAKNASVHVIMSG